MKFFYFTFLITVSAVIFNSKEAKPEEKTIFDWRSVWAVEEGFSISIDTQGYHFPSAIAFVPKPGKGPKDPLYFVTEIRGKVKVVTNDRTVYTFAEDFFPFSFTPEEELEALVLQTGIAGICLEPQRGYVFVTFAYQDSSKILRNNIVRFQSVPGTFSLKPLSQVAFTDIFFSYESGVHHQIGPCQIKDDLLYVSIGDAYQPFQAQNLDSMLGKIIRMTLDGKPVPENPFYQDADRNKSANYVWAYGFRNPFSLKIVKNQVFVADNGNDTDKFLEVHKGENCLWNGDNRSTATNAGFVFIPSIGPVQLDYYPAGSLIFPEEYRQSFFLAASATVKEKTAGIMTFEYGLKENRLLDFPRYFLKFRGPGDAQSVVGLAFGPDGLYVVPLLPNREGRSYVLKISHEPDTEYPFRLQETSDALSMIYDYGCVGCHSLTGDQARAGLVGPPLGGGLVKRIEKRLESEKYLEYVKELDRLDSEPFRSHRAARKEIIEADGVQRVRTWIKYHLMEPRFDNSNSQMPNFGFSEKEALKITNFLIRKSGRIESLKIRIAKFLPSLPLQYRDLILFFVLGFFLGLFLSMSPRIVKSLIPRSSK